MWTSAIRTHAKGYKDMLRVRLANRKRTHMSPWDVEKVNCTVSYTSRCRIQDSSDVGIDLILGIRYKCSSYNQAEVKVLPGD